MRTAILKTKELEQYLTREIRDNVVEELKKSISENGFLMGHNLTVVGNKIIDGNHRHKAASEAGITELPCVVYDEGEINAYDMSERLNAGNDTYAKKDLFDMLYKIQKMKDEGLTQREISEILRWGKDNTSRYSILVEKISPKFLEKSKTVQINRCETDSPRGEKFDFTEGWFRDSGLYGLDEEYQLLFFEKFKGDKFNWSKQKVQQMTAQYKLWQEMTAIAEDRLVDSAEIIKLIKKGTFSTMERLNAKIAEILKEQKNRLICGSAEIELAGLDDGSINVVITDPPYGIDYASNRSKYAEHVAKEAIENDDETAFGLLDKVCGLLLAKTAEDAHLYFFASWKVYPRFEAIISRYFDVKNMIVWDKCNHSMGDLTGAWGNRHELIIFAAKGDRSVNARKGDIIAAPRVSSQTAIHTTQKPEALIKELLTVSAMVGDTVCDPFMGSGSTVRAVKEYDGRLNYIGIEIDRERYEKAKTYIGGA